MRLVLLLLGFTALIAGAACGASGVASLRSLDEDDNLLSGPSRLTTSTAGFVGSTAELAGRSSGIRNNSVTIRIRVSDGRGLFLGIAPAAAADPYLAAARHEAVDQVRYDPLELRRTAVGAGDALAPPADALAWTASASGDAPLDLTWSAQNGDYVFVILRADGRPGVDAAVEFGTKFRYQRGYAIAGIALGAVLVAVGLLLAVGALRRRSPAPPSDG
ncbi:MAG: hypothetical protein K6U88_03190 [Dehalococcoidia bacterium]|nr:hypothetical protein [Dehalococcoidia bacterium]